MPKPIAFEWVNNGEPFELEDMPIAGYRAIDDMKRKRTKQLANWSEAMFLNRCQNLLAIKRILTKSGVKEAVKHWPAARKGLLLGEALDAQLEWDEGSFESNFSEWYTNMVLTPLGVTDYDAALAELNHRAKSLDLSNLSVDMQGFERDVFLTGLYWRLYWRFGTISVPATDGKREERPLTIENLALIVRYPSDAQKVLEALASESETDISKVWKVKSEEDVQGNSGKNAEPLTPSRPDSPSSSTPTTATEIPSASATP